jgi:hypothetical protein
MIKLYENMYLSADSLQYTLVERSVYKEGKNVGKEYDTIRGYFPSLKLLFEKLFDDEIKKEIASENLKTLEELRKRFLKLSVHLKNMSTKIGSVPSFIKKIKSNDIESLEGDLSDISQ